MTPTEREGCMSGSLCLLFLRNLGVVIVLLYLSASPLLAKRNDDRVVLKNGDHITGEIKRIERGTLYRSDHFPFMRAGVPALSFEPGTEFVGRSEDWYAKTFAEWTATRYHRPQDEVGPWYVYDGAAQETRVALRVAQLAADASAQPTWNLDSEFRAAGDTRVKSRQ